MTDRTNESAKPAISLLGAPRIDLKGEPVALPRRRTRALLYFLAASPGDHGRDELVDLLWPNLDPGKGRRQLSDALSDLRRTLGGDIIVSDSETVALTGVTCDASVFAAAVDEAGRLDGEAPISKLSDALDLYGGEFLSGFGIDGSEALDEWVQEQRLNLCVAALGAFARVGSLRLERGDSNGAIEVAKRGLALDNLREDLWRVLIEARSDMGDRAGALAEYSRCSETLRRELGVMPEAETEALRRRISAERGTPAAGAVESTAAQARPPLPFSLRLPGSSLALVGRERELGFLLRAWDAARDGGGGLAAIEGEPGIGKSRLAAEFAARAAGSRAIVLAARCPDLNDPPPYGPIEEAIRGVLPSMPSGAFSKLGAEWLPWVGRLLPELGLGVEAPDPLSPEEEKARLAEAAGQVLDAVAGQRPLLLIVEDVHWAHPSTVLLLHAVARRHRRMLVLTTMRDTEPLTDGTEMARRMFADLAKEGLATAVSLSALGASDTVSLVRLAIDAAGAGTKAMAAAVAELAEGQPLFALELTRAVLESPDNPDLPDSLTNAIGFRIDRASEFAQRVLELAAVFGRPVTPQLLGRAAGVEPAEESLVRVSEELCARRLLQEEASGEMSLTHGLIQAAVYKSLSVSRRRALHARVATALESGGELPAGTRSESLARHYRLAGDLERATDHLVAAAERADALGEVDTAAARFRSAADLLLRMGHERDAALALERAGKCVWRRCDISTATAAFKDALAIWDTIDDNEEGRMRMHAALAQLVTRWGYLITDRSEIGRHLDEAIQLTEGTDGEERSLALSARGFVRAIEGDLVGAQDDAENAMRLAGDSEAAWHSASDLLSAIPLLQQRYQEGLAVTLERVARASAAGELYELHDALATAAWVHLLIGDPVSAEEHALAAEEAGLKSRYEGLSSKTCLADALVSQERWSEADAFLDDLLADPLHATDRPSLVATRRYLKAELLARRGEVTAARRVIRETPPVEHFDLAMFGRLREVYERAQDAVQQANARKKRGVTSS